MDLISIPTSPLKLHRIVCKTTEAHATVKSALDDYARMFILDDTRQRDGTSSFLLSCTEVYARSLEACSNEVTTICIEDQFMGYTPLY